jgi:hypothetical protein
MGPEHLGASPIAPIFIFADHDRQAIERILEALPEEWSYIPVSNPKLVVKYAKRIATTAVFLAAPIDYPRGGAETLLQNLLDDVGKPVILMTESWSPEIRDRWKRMGATDCIPHPTRTQERIATIRRKVQDLALTQMNQEGKVGPLQDS